MLQERDAFAALLNSLTSTQQKNATLEGTYRDILAGPQADDGILSEQEGLSASTLSLGVSLRFYGISECAAVIIFINICEVKTPPS